MTRAAEASGSSRPSNHRPDSSRCRGATGVRVRTAARGACSGVGVDPPLLLLPLSQPGLLVLRLAPALRALQRAAQAPLLVLQEPQPVFLAQLVHVKAILCVQAPRPGRELRALAVHGPQPALTPAGPLCSAAAPNLRKVVAANVVLRHSNSIIQVDHAMPPVARYIDGLPSMLHTHQRLEVRILPRALPRQQVQEVVARFIVVLWQHDIFGLGHLLGRLRGQQQPELPANQQRVPG
mmetsp:Transcript_90564/g.216233  ORF Transcript_90564/g.216233 Transcript_90564/m.216233 type:complete len:237 (+) Transcript_90564:253-963(+)